MLFRLFSILLLLNSTVASGQKKMPSKWSLLTAYEVNYTGNNAVLHTVYKPHIKHTVEFGVNYNFSDGFAKNPLIGIGVSYGFSALQTASWDATLGMDYRRQKPLDIVNIQIITYTTKVAYIIGPKWSILTRLGYGLVLERARSAGPFTQSNNITGSSSLGCVFHL